jgi:hypothetical protein
MEFDAEQTPLDWLRACEEDSHTRAELPGPVAMITGTDAAVLRAIAECWKVAGRGGECQRGALVAVRALLPAMQPKCRLFARELIAFALDWSDRARLWPLVACQACDGTGYPPKFGPGKPPGLGGAISCEACLGTGQRPASPSGK